MFDREKLLDMVNDPREREVVARGLDLAQGVLRTYTPIVSEFYDPFHTALLTSILERIPDLSLTPDGGYPGAERKRIVLCPDYLDPQAEDYGLTFFSIQGNLSSSRINHRDFLGSLLGLGLRREKLGDIIVSNTGAQLVVAREIADFVRINLNKVGRTTIKIQEISRNELTPPLPKVKEIKTTVPSLRLDVVAAGAFGDSRSKMAREVSAQKVAVNWRLCTNQAAPVKEGDIISVRGKGRAEVAEVGGRTKKGRIAVILCKYM